MRGNRLTESQLQQLGVDVPASAYTVEQAADLLAPLLKGGRPTC